MDLKIEYLNKEELKPYVNNAKLHPAEQIEQIKKSIQEFGFNDPIAVWHDNEIVEGHGRLLAVMEMDEIEKIPVIRLDDLTDEQRREYMLVHNKITMNSDFDFDILNAELEDLPDFDAEFYDFEIRQDVIVEDQIDGGEIENKEDVGVAVRIVFKNATHWRKEEEKLRKFVDDIDGVTVSVGEYHEDK